MGVIVRRRGPVSEAMKRLKRGWRKWRADVHLVSYPKCGRTWLVLLIGQALQQHYGVYTRNPLKLRRLTSRRRGIPYIHQHHDGGPEFLLPEEISADKSAYRGRKVVFLVRDPRDVLVSSYFQKTRRNYNYEGTFADYVHERRGGIESIVRFYNVWAANRSVPRDFLLVAYEDLHADAAAELERVLRFIGLDEVAADAGAVERAVDACSFDNMRALERNNAYGTGALSARDTSDESSYKTRRGEIGGYRDYLEGEELAFVDRVIDQQLDPLYERYRSTAR